MKHLKSKKTDLHVTYTARGLPRYEVKATHEGLNKVQVFRGDDPHVVREKAAAQMRNWDNMWEKKVAAEARKANIADKKSLAEYRTREALEAQNDLERILASALDVDDRVDWETIKEHSPFPIAKPSRQDLPPDVLEPGLWREPKASDPIYQPQIGLLDKLMSSRREKRELEARSLFESDQSKWQAYQKAKAERNRQVEIINESHQEQVEEWEREKREYEEQQEQRNAALDRLREKYEAGGDPKAIENHSEIVLSSSQYPDYFPQDYDLEYNPSNKTLIVDDRLPAKGMLPTLKEVRYIQSRDELDEKHISDAQLNKLYDLVVYQIGLRTIHELFEADTISALDSVVFNGMVEFLDPATGKDAVACIMSVQTTKDEFLEIKLAAVEPKTCFKKLGGVGSSKLHSMTPVKPLQRVSREDSRFVEGREIAIGEGDNLAAMDWEDFEHLIRELFEKRFAKDGGEVKVTKASRDGGVDAIAFDPDPIRGGKIVIQAKRYTNTVGVDAVRDLYGTVQHEGAMLGILVTTSDYGPDAYAFARGKPINLLNGGELLYMLGEYGHKARIDIREAKEILAEREGRK